MNRIKNQSIVRTIYKCFRDPLYITKKMRRKQVEQHLCEVSGLTLDIGCGTRPYEKNLRGQVTKYIGLDYPSTMVSNIKPDIYSDALTLPVKNGSIDTVLCFEVLNFLYNPLILFKEIYRVLRPSGVFLLSSPLIRGVSNEETDFFRFTPQGLKLLADQARLEIDNILPCGGLWAMTGQRISSSIIEKAKKKKMAKLYTPFLCGFIQCIGLALDKLWFWPNESLHFFVVGKKPSN